MADDIDKGASGFFTEGAARQAGEFNDALKRSGDASRALTSRLNGALEKMANTSDEAYRFLDALKGINELTRNQADLL